MRRLLRVVPFWDRSWYLEAGNNECPKNERSDQNVINCKDNSKRIFTKEEW